MHSSNKIGVKNNLILHHKCHKIHSICENETLSRSLSIPAYARDNLHIKRLHCEWKEPGVREKLFSKLRHEFLRRRTDASSSLGTAPGKSEDSLVGCTNQSFSSLSGQRQKHVETFPEANHPLSPDIREGKPYNAKEDIKDKINTQKVNNKTSKRFLKFAETDEYINCNNPLFYSLLQSVANEGMGEEHYEKKGVLTQERRSNLKNIATTQLPDSRDISSNTHQEDLCNIEGDGLLNIYNEIQLLIAEDAQNQTFCTEYSEAAIVEEKYHRTLLYLLQIMSKAKREGCSINAS